MIKNNLDVFIHCKEGKYPTCLCCSKSCKGISAHRGEIPLSLRYSLKILVWAFVDLDNNAVHLGSDEHDNERSEGRLSPLLPARDATRLKLQLEEYAGSEFFHQESAAMAKLHKAPSILSNGICGVQSFAQSILSKLAEAEL